MSERVDNVACTVCGCVCDDLRVTVDGGRVVRAEGACQLAEPWFLAQDTPPPAGRRDRRPAGAAGRGRSTGRRTFCGRRGRR